MADSTPRKRRSPLARYAPFIAVGLIVVIIAIVVAVSGGNDNKNSVNTGPNTTGQPSDVPLQFPAAKAAGKADSTTWQEHCDTTIGYVAIPVNNSAPCVPKFTGDNGGDLSPAVTKDTIRIGYYIAPPSQYDVILQSAGAYDKPSDVEATVKDYVQLYSQFYELYGRKVQLVKIEGSGPADDEVAARNDAEKAAKQDHVFAVIGGPAQARSFSETLAANGVLCVGTCSIASPQAFYESHAPYVWTTSPSPEQTSAMITEFIQKQLVGKNAQYAGEADFKNKKRTFALLSYDTKDGQYAASWDDFEKQLKAAGVPIVLHKSYQLDVTRIPQIAKDIAVALKQADATSVIFTGDPLMPIYFTQQATDQKYFPEWIMAGTVFADTSVFARKFDQTQWAHAFGLQLTPARVTQDINQAYTLHKWYFGKPPPSENSYAVTWGNAALLFAGLQTAGPKLTPENFQAGMFAIAPKENVDNTIDTVVTYGQHNLWPYVDHMGLDNAGMLWWDPNAQGQDETGADGKGLYRLVDGGRRYINGKWPTEPMKLFDPAGTVTVYDKLPPDLAHKDYPTPPGSPAAGG